MLIGGRRYWLLVITVSTLLVMTADTHFHVARRGAGRIVAELVGLQRGERVIVVADDTSDQAALGIVVGAIRNMSAEVRPVAASEFMDGLDGDADVVVSLAHPLLTHANEMRRRLRGGARYANLRGLDTELLEQAAVTDFDAVHRLTRALAERMASIADVQVHDDAGTEFRMRLAGRALALSGVAKNGGEVGGFPGGEVALVPVPGSVQGVVRSPRFIEGFSGDGAGAVIHIRDSIVQLDHESAPTSYLDSALSPSDAARSIGEFGLGTNGVLAASSPRTAKKRLGMVHIGIGDNRTFGGEIAADAHIDVILATPSVTVDGHALIQHGELTWSP